MKIAAIIARILLGLMFTFFGLNGLVHFSFMSKMPMPTGDALAWFMIMMTSRWLAAIAITEVLGGLMTLSGRFTPLGLVFLGPVLINALLYHATLWSQGAGMAIFCSLLELFLIYACWGNFKGLFAAPASS